MVSNLIDILGVNTFIDICCICRLNSAGQSNPNGWVIELNSNEEVSRGIGFMLMQHQFSLAWVSFMVRVNYHFVWIQHQLQAQVWGRSLNIIIAIHISRSPTWVSHNIICTNMTRDKARTPESPDYLVVWLMNHHCLDPHRLQRAIVCAPSTSQFSLIHEFEWI